MRSHSPILQTGTCLTSLIMGVTTVFNECYKILTSPVNATVCLLLDSCHLLGTCHTCSMPQVNVALVRRVFILLSAARAKINFELYSTFVTQS